MVFLCPMPGVNIIISMSCGSELVSASSMTSVHAISLYVITSFQFLSNSFLFHWSQSSKRFSFKHAIRRNTLQMFTSTVTGFYILHNVTAQWRHENCLCMKYLSPTCYFKAHRQLQIIWQIKDELNFCSSRQKFHILDTLF